MNFKNPLTIIVLCFMVSACQPKDANYVCVGNKCVNVEVVSNSEDVRKGLQHRTSLGKNNGMLFAFADYRPHKFWMKDTLIPLDIIWMDHTKRVIYIERDVQPCQTDPCPTYGPNQKAMYVLEMNAGHAKRLTIDVGTEMTFRLANN